MATRMPKHHLIYFENGLSRPKSKSYSRLRLDHASAAKPSRAGSSSRPESSPAGRQQEGRGRKTAAAADEESAMADTVVASWGTPAATPAKVGDPPTPSALVSAWLHSAVLRLAPLALDTGRGPEAAQSARRFSDPGPSAPAADISTADQIDLSVAEQLDQVKTRFAAWKAFQQQHFDKEEEAMMPLTQKVSPTPLGRCRAVHRHLVNPVVDRSPEEFVFFIGWCTGKLSQYGSTQHPAEVAVRVFTRALQSASSAAQWAAFMPVLQAHCSPDIWESMVALYNVDLPFGDDLLMGSVEADFHGDPPMAFAVMLNAHEALRAGCAEMERMTSELDSRYEMFSAALKQYNRALAVHTAMEDENMFPLLDTVNGSPLGLGHLHAEDDALMGQLLESMDAYEAAKKSRAKSVINSKAKHLWEGMLAAMERSMEQIDYATLVEVEKETKKTVWLQSALGYLCILQGLRDTGVDTINRSLFKELRSLLMFLQTTDFRTVQMRRLKKATEYYKEHIQMLPVVKSLVREHQLKTGATASANLDSSGSKPKKSKSLVPGPSLAIMRWIVCFQMLIEMRLMAAEKKELRKQEQMQHRSAPVLAPLHPTERPPRQWPQAQAVYEENSVSTHASKYMLSCNDIFKISDQMKDPTNQHY